MRPGSMFTKNGHVHCGQALSLAGIGVLRPDVNVHRGG